MARRSLACCLAALALVASACAYRKVPLVPADRPVAESSRVLAADGALITTLHAQENRESVTLDQVPASLRDAVVAIEDERFWDHPGVDLRAMVRAAYADASAGRVAEGASTITQQYVKNVLLGDERSVRRKVREASLAVQLERQASKAQILERYLNTVYMGNGAYGVQAAALTYFGVPVERLDLSQSALLAGIIQAPTAYDPVARPDAAAARRNVVLDKLLALGKVSPPVAAEARSRPLGTTSLPGSERYPAPYAVEEVKRQVLEDPRYGAGASPEERANTLFRGGLRITTTIDLRRQAQAEQAVGRVLSRPGSDPAAAVVSLDPRTGAIQALVGGSDFFGSQPEAKLDLATQAHRQAGSSFKPFVLAAALEAGVPLTKTYPAPAEIDIPIPRQPPWRVRNYEGGSRGRLDLVEATVGSVNTVYAQLVMEVGPAAAVDLARRMGVASPLAPYPSAALGANDLTPLDMASAYSTLANRGVHHEPVLISKVTRPDGTLLYENRPREERVLTTAVADATVPVLQQVVERGTGTGARIGRPVAGKTGTTEEWRDAWFVGFTPELVTSVWVGFPRGQVSMVPPTTREKVEGGTWPAQIWQLYTTGALADTPVSTFPLPPAPGPSSGGAVREVPAVVATPVERAEDTLTSGGWRSTRRPVANRDYPPGYVVSQSPCGGCAAPGGSTVTLSVASPSASATTVPDVLGSDAAAARGALAAAGFVPDVVVEAEPPSPGAATRRGRAWKQAPAGGQAGDGGSRVRVWVNPS